MLPRDLQEARKYLVIDLDVLVDLAAHRITSTG
jgi:hypothetical protein